MRRLFDLLILSAWIAACAPAPPEQVRYLQTAIHSATQDQVAQRLGAPERTVALTDGGSVWTYRYQSTGPSSALGAVQPVTCEEFTLTFDAKHTLRRWIQQSCDLTGGTLRGSPPPAAPSGNPRQ